jgi:SH3-like domain-containing protein
MGRTLVACLALSTALAVGASSSSAAEAQPGEKLPRFVSLRSDQVNLRVGPGENYPIQWVLTRKEMPVEIIKEFEHWRMIHDWQGTEGWVHERMVSGKRTVAIKGGIARCTGSPI